MAKTKTTTASAEGPVCGRCGGDRLESFSAPAPDGKAVRLIRCVDCGEQAATKDVEAGTVSEVGAPMLVGEAREPVGPEDALGPGPKRGDYRDRLGGSTLSTEVTVGADGRPEVVRQAPRAADVGESPGRKGGVDSGGGE